MLNEDASILALRDVHSDPSNKENLVILPEETVESYYRGLVHIYNANSIAARDSVIEIYEIHSFPYPETHALIVSVDSTKNWVSAWQNGQRLTGNQQIDFLMETYDLQLDRYYHWSWAHAAVLLSEEAINIFALSKKFKPIDGIIYAESIGVCCDGDDIEGNIESNYISFEFSEGWGDCLAGCIHRHYWMFHVKFNGTVEFIGSYGDPLP